MITRKEISVAKIEFLENYKAKYVTKSVARLYLCELLRVSLKVKFLNDLNETGRASFHNEVDALGRRYDEQAMISFYNKLRQILPSKFKIELKDGVLIAYYNN